MISYLLRRVLTSLIILFGILTITFFIIRLAPGEPIALFENPSIDSESRELIRHAYGLDKPVYIQYFRWLTSLLFYGNFGYSLVQNKPVSQILLRAIPNTIILMSAALFINFVLGIFIGVISASRKFSKFDHALSIAGLTIYSLPLFWFSLISILLFAYLIPIFPPSHMYSIGAESMGLLHRTFDLFRHLFLPAFCLGLTAAATTARFTRAGLIEILNEDFIRAARAKGTSEKNIITKHSLRNALLPIITLFGLYLPFLIGGSLIVEVIFAWPGMGRVAYNGIMGRDYPLIIGATFVSSAMVILGNLIADILYAVADPRVRYSR
jgi:peptide/nickel transport system permease protein